jgi:nicotinate-nucleotide adenylyltransferase
MPQFIQNQSTSRLVTGVFGSAFNPPTLGHLAAITEAIQFHGVHRLIVTPSFSHAFGKNMLDFDVRMELAKRALSTLPLSIQNKITLSSIEKDLNSLRPNQPVYSYDVLIYLRHVHPIDTIRLVLGPDNILPETFNKFKNADIINRDFGVIGLHTASGARSSMCRPQFLAAQNGSPEALSFLSENLPLPVMQYCLQHSLYATSS